MDTRLLKESFAAVAPHADELVAYFYADLFRRGGDPVMDMFPPLMSYQRDRLLSALVRIVTDVDDLDKLSGYLAGLGRDHRKFGVQPEHFAVVGQSLLATLARFAGPAWTRETAETWAGAYSLVAQVMVQALEDGDGSPPWWDAVVTGKERRSPDVTVLHVRLGQPMTWRPGQSVAVLCAAAPRIWRYFTPANAPRPDGVMELHVKVIPGGMMSGSLARLAGPGTPLKLGPPVGVLALDEASGRDALMMAGSTGLAPMLAMTERLAQRESPPRVALYFGARDPDGLYGRDTLAKLAQQYSWLEVRHAVSAPPEETPDYDGAHGSIVDVALRDGPWSGRDIYVCGSAGMTRAARGRLQALGIPEAQIHIEDFGWEG